MIFCEIDRSFSRTASYEQLTETPFRSEIGYGRKLSGESRLVNTFIPKRHFLARYSNIITAAIILISTSVAALAQDAPKPPTPGPFVEAEAHQAVEALAKHLEEDFIYPQTGKAYAEMLRAKVKNGAYSKFADAGEFAKTVTRDLQAVQPEGHLRLQPPVADAAGKAVAGPPPARPRGVGKYGWLTPEVAYFSYHGFSGSQEEYAKVVAKLREVLDGFSNAKTLIIDARRHPGGGLDDMDAMFSYFYDKPTTLVTMDTRLEVEKRNGSPLEDTATLKRVTGPEGIVRRTHVTGTPVKNTGLNKAQIFLLTSNYTASAGEHLSLALKRTKRATLIGETTRGAGHFGRTAQLGGGYRAFIPVGRTFDPDTDKGWEQVGVEPDVKTPADAALDEALKRAGVTDIAKAKKAWEAFVMN